MFWPRLIQVRHSHKCELRTVIRLNKSHLASRHLLGHSPQSTLFMMTNISLVNLHSFVACVDIACEHVSYYVVTKDSDAAH